MLNTFRLDPITSAEEAIRSLAENPGVLGQDWRLASRPAAVDSARADLLFHTPGGCLLVCLVAPLIDGDLLARGLIAHGAIRHSLPFLPGLAGQGNRGYQNTRLLLLGGRVDCRVLHAAGEQVEIKLLGQVTGQPGPPLLVYEPPILFNDAPRGELGAAMTGPSPFQVEDEEIEKILSHSDVEATDEG